MTMKEIKSLLDIPTSTMSDWDKSVKRAKLAKLLKNIDIDTVNRLLRIEDNSPKYSQKTQKIRLNKKLFTKDILWAKEDGSEVSIKHLVSALFNIPNQEDTTKLLELFGEVRVRNILKKQKFIMRLDDYNEMDEQIQYVLSPNTYHETHELPPIDTILHHPKQRHIDRLRQIYSEDVLLDIAKESQVNLTTLLQIKKFLLISA
ncbi:MAG: hypothetical protein ACI9TV_000813 [Sulfurimonas sp.]|jgi:hypothetical protein|uniref:hypothetical protein n=1 Tax=Sulfurimonas sp. TaxID=2022749 RepID=UPI0039E5A301